MIGEAEGCVVNGEGVVLGAVGKRDCWVAAEPEVVSGVAEGKVS